MHMFRSRALLYNFHYSPDFPEPIIQPKSKGIRIDIRGILTPDLKEAIEKSLELIPEELGIKYVNDDDRHYFQNRPFYNEKIQSDMVIEWVHEGKEDVITDSSLIFKAFYALRLLKEGPVFIKYVYTIDEEKGIKVSDANFEVPDTYPDYDRQINYELTTHDVQQFKEIFALISKEKELDRTIDLGLDRLNSTYYPKAVRDVLLDIMIAFEALFLKDYRGGWKGEVMAIACSMLLGKTRLERESIRKKLSHFYNIRNYIVHGQEYDSNEIIQNLYTLRNYLRRSIITLLI